MERELRVDLTDLANQVQIALGDAFGSPDAPTWPSVLLKSESYRDLTDEKDLLRASGPVGRRFDLVEVGLFRKQCAQCHGIAGDGFGPTAGLLDPYPRDFRRGTFKFKDTSYGRKPTLEDLVHTIENGVPGTSMPAMKNLKLSKHYDDDIPVLAKYVRFLAIRGEVERELMMDTLRNLDEGELLYDPSQSRSAPETFLKNQKRIDDVIVAVAESWLSQFGAREDPDISPYSKFVKNSEFAQSNLLTESESTPAFELRDSIERGRELFSGGIAACAQCHGKDGTGEPKWQDFDEWTKDWTIRSGINPMVKSEWKPLKELGLLTPVAASPRNLTLGVFRGTTSLASITDDPAHTISPRKSILRAVLNGLEGSPMPAAAVFPETVGGMSEDQVIDLVRYVESLSTPEVAQAKISQALSLISQGEDGK